MRSTPVRLTIIAGLLAASIVAAVSAQSGNWTAVRTVDKFDDATNVSARVVASVATLDLTRSVTFTLGTRTFTVPCSIVTWNGSSKQFEVPQSVQNADQQWQRWKESGGGKEAWDAVNKGERWDPKGKQSTQCCANFEANATCKGAGSSPNADVIACYGETVRRCVVDENVRLVSHDDLASRLKDLSDQVSPEVREADLRKMLSDLNARFDGLERQVQSLEDGTISDAGKPGPNQLGWMTGLGAIAVVATVAVALVVARRRPRAGRVNG
jgi:hypothetical protein